MDSNILAVGGEAMFLLKLSFRNLTRHRKRTLLTAAVIALAVFFYIFFDSMMLGMREESFQSIIDFESAHLQVAHEEYWEKREKKPLEDLLKYDQKLIDDINSREEIKAFSPHLKFSARLNNGRDELPVRVRAVETEREKEVYSVENYFIKGEFFQAGEKGAVIGQELAELMSLKQGDYFTLLARTKEGTYNTIELEIKGLFQTPNPNLNSNTVFVPLDVAQKSLNVEDSLTQVAIKLNNREKAPKVAEELNNRFSKGIGAYTWRDSASALISLTRMQAIENKIILSIILIIAAVGIINTVILAGIERVEEIGMMKAMGMKRWEIVSSFVLESTGIGIIGGGIGCLAAYIAVALFHRYGIDFFNMFGMGEMPTFGFPIIGRIYGVWNPTAFIFMFLFAVLVTTVVSLFPALWAAGKDVVKAIHHH
ncbi:MAG: ABC transporter permease [Halanaerobiales bacterium]